MPTYGGGWRPSTYAFPGGLIADAGEYLGPWPPDPILEQNLPEDAREIDYLIVLPPPSGDIDLAGQGGYSSVGYREWIYRGVSGSIARGNSGIFQAGNATGTDRPEGAHLYVGWFPLGATGQPAESPQQVVPQDWTIAARGWTRAAGHWSDWQEAGTVHKQLGVEHRQWQQFSFTRPDNGLPASTDVAAEVETMREWTRSWVPGEAGPLGPTATVTVGWNHDVYGAGPIFADAVRVGARSGKTSTTATAIVDQLNSFSASWRASDDTPPLDSYPSLLSSLTQGEDFDLIPGTSDYVQYESSEPTFAGWDDLDTHLHVIAAFGDRTIGPGGSVSNVTAPPDYVVNVYFGTFDGPGGEPENYYGPAPGTLLQEVRWNLADHGWVDDGSLDPITFDLDYTLNLSEITLDHLTVWWQSSYFSTDPFDMPDFPAPGAGIEQRRDINYLAGGVLGLPYAQFRMPRFRYWALGELVPAVVLPPPSSAPQGRTVAWV